MFGRNKNNQPQATTEESESPDNADAEDMDEALDLSEVETAMAHEQQGIVDENDDADIERELRSAIEAICMVSDQPVPASLLGEVLEVSVAKIDELCAQLVEEYSQQKRGFVLANVAGGWRFQSHADLAPYVERFVLDGQSARLSGAALETLAIVAYKQPMSRAQIAAIRGVNVDGVLKTLQQRGYVTELGHDPGPGQAILFGTTPLFLEKLGIASLADLPPLGDFIPDAQLVEALEQGLRPSSAIDLREDLEDRDHESTTSAEIDAPSEAHDV